MQANGHAQLRAGSAQRIALRIEQLQVRDGTGFRYTALKSYSRTRRRTSSAARVGSRMSMDAAPQAPCPISAQKSPSLAVVGSAYGHCGLAVHFGDACRPDPAVEYNTM